MRGTSARIAPGTGTIVLLAGLASTAFASKEARAGSGPWVPGAGETQVFIGGDAQRFAHLGITDINGDRQVLEVDEGVSAVDVKAIASYGILGRFEIEGSIPWYHVYANRTDGALCGALGLGACKTTESIGILTLRGKALVLDELAGRPLSLAVGGEMRHGAFSYSVRERITNVGEGSLDTGAFLTAGRVGGIGADGSWAAFLELGGRYRFANTTSYTDASCAADAALAAKEGDTAPSCDESSVPGNEWFGAFDFLVSPRFPVAFGPSVAGLWRPDGLAFYELDATDEDRFSALRVGLVRAGGKVILRNQAGTSFVASVLGTVFAYNNPTDAVLFSMGIGFPLGKDKDG
jgi:hypothetical protein